MAGKLFVIDGVDGSGKNTQAMELYMSFIQEGYRADEEVTMVSFPRYKQPSAKFVEMYLNGEFSKDPMDIDPYTASMFYTIDRSISFKNEKWGEVYRNGGIVIADRYYTSNIIHQGAKILSSEENKKKYDFDYFICWIKELELDQIMLPAPDKIFWLMTDAKANDDMMKHRVDTNIEHVTDIHEANHDYLDLCRQALIKYKDYYETDLSHNVMNQKAYSPFSREIRREEFINVRNENGELRSITNISNEIIQNVNEYLHP